MWLRQRRLPRRVSESPGSIGIKPITLSDGINSVTVPEIRHGALCWLPWIDGVGRDCQTQMVRMEAMFGDHLLYLQLAAKLKDDDS